MNRPQLTLGLVLIALVAIQCAGAQQSTLTLSNQTISSGAVIDQATQTITAGPAFTINGSANVAFQAGTSITLLPGFTASGASGASFKAFIAPISDYTINGTVTNSTGGAVAGATVTLSGSMGGSTTTASNGTYSLAVAPGAAYSYMVTPSMSGQSFNPVSMGPYTNVNANITGVNFSEASGGTLIADLASLQACVALNGPAVCQLDAKDITVDSTININRYGVTITGMNTSADHTRTRLIRGAHLTGNMIDVAVPGTNTSSPTATLGASQAGIVIENLTVCGGGNPNNTYPPGSPWLPAFMSPSGPKSTAFPCADQHVNPSPCAYETTVCVDLSIDNVDSGYYPPNPFGSTPFANTSCPFTAGCYAVEVNNVDMEDAPQHAIRLYSQGPYTNQQNKSEKWAAQKVNDVWIHNSAINYSAVTGILAGFNFQTYNDKFCDTYALHNSVAFADDRSLIASRNIRIENNTFQYNNTGTIAFNSAGRWIGVRNNYLFVNYIQPQSGNGGGGSISFEDCSDHVDIANNVITGPSASTVQVAGIALPTQGTYTIPPQTSGLELYSRNTEAFGNSVTAHGTNGIGAYSLWQDPTVGSQFPENGTVAAPSIAQNHVLQDNAWAASTFSGAVMVGNNFVYSTVCDIRPRDTNQLVTGVPNPSLVITANDSNSSNATTANAAHGHPVALGSPTLPYGVKLTDHYANPPEYDTGRLYNVTVDPSNSFVGKAGLIPLWLDPYVGLYNYISQVQYQTNASTDQNPRILPVDVTDASSSTSSFTSLWPVPPLCADPPPSDPNNPLPPPVPPESGVGGPRAKFEFLASDAHGASNIVQIQGIWGTLGSDVDGTPGPSGTLCKFEYYVPYNYVYLWDYRLQTWLQPSSVGRGGTDLVDSGSGCVIHAGSSLVQSTRSGAIPEIYVVDLTLDVTLPPPMAHYHIYSSVQNATPGYYNACTTTCPWQYWGYWPNYQQSQYYQQ